MRWLALLFVVLIVALQYPMWLGKGGWLQVRETDRQLAVQREANEKLKARNAALDADVRDLKTGSEAIEERARAELGMIRSDEVFFQLQQGAVMSGTATKDGATKALAPSKAAPSKSATPAAAVKGVAAGASSRGAVAGATPKDAVGADRKGAAAGAAPDSAAR